MTVISYPIPAYQNLPIEENFYSPRRFEISAISLGFTTTITTSEALNFTVGQKVRLIIPPENGSRQLNGTQSLVISLPSDTQVELDLDSSSNVDPFIAGSTPQVPQILPIGDVNTGAINSNGRTQNINFINGSFINISPE